MDNTPENVSESEDAGFAIEKDTVEITVKDIIQIMYRNKKLFFVSSSLAFTVITVIFLFFLTPVYDVRSSI